MSLIYGKTGLQVINKIGEGVSVQEYSAGKKTSEKTMYREA